MVTNPNWPEANQLAIYKLKQRDGRFELGTPVNKSSQQLGLDLKEQIHGSAHAHSSKCCFSAATCCIVYESNMIMS